MEIIGTVDTCMLYHVLPSYLIPRIKHPNQFFSPSGKIFKVHSTSVRVIN